MPSAGDDLMELRGGRGSIVVNGIECSWLEHGFMGYERGKLRMALIAGVL